MKTKIWLIVSLINAAALLGFYLGLLNPLLQQHRTLDAQQTILLETVLANQQAITSLKESSKNFSPAKNPSMAGLLKTLLKLAKQQNLNIKQLEPNNTENSAKKNTGLVLQANGSYSAIVKFIFYVNQLPFLLHWSSITLLRVNTDLELTGIIIKNG